MTEAIAEFFERDIRILIDEINLFKNEEHLWKLKEGITNSAGNLALHLIGNLNYFFGTILANSGYERHRDLEFSSKDVPRRQMVADLQNAIPLVKNILANLSEADYKKDYPISLNGKNMSTEATVIYLLTHLNYHRGQVNYLRRILEK